MRIGFVGAGHIGGNAARLLSAAGHDVALSFSRNPARLSALAAEIGPRAIAADPPAAAAFGDVVFLSVPWQSIDEAISLAGPMDGKVVIDTTNPFGPRGMALLPAGMTSARFNQGRLPSSTLVKAFNTLTAAFQAGAATRSGVDRAALFLAGDSVAAKSIVAGLIRDAGFTPVDVGSADQSSVMEAPRRAGSVYGEEYREADALEAAAAWREGRPIGPTPAYPQLVAQR